MTWVRRVAGITIAVMSALAVPAPHAAARTYYEYWSYWHKPPGATSWQYSSVGPSGYYLKSGTQVEGWRFAVGTASPSDPQPRPTSASYGDYCAGKNTDKTYRVLLVVDYGTSSSAPSGPVYSCYGFNNSVTGYEVLTQQHSERDQSGLICAIDGYPHSGCGETVSSPAPHASSTPKKTQPATSTTHRTSTKATKTRPTSVASARATSSLAAATPKRPQATPPATSSAASSSAATSTATQTPAGATTPTPTTTARLFTGNKDAASSSFPVGLVIGLAGLAALGGGALWLRRRNP
jgi:MYXO-CTERM domain-containing protein